MLQIPHKCGKFATLSYLGHIHMQKEMHFIYSFSPSFGAILASPGYAIFLVCVVLIIRFLKLTSFDEKPQLTLRQRKEQSRTKLGHQDTYRACDKGKEGNNLAAIDLAEVLEQCLILRETYTPPPIWGRNGHLQTAAYGLLGHHSLKRTYNQRHSLNLPDGATATFDVFEPVSTHKTGGDYTLVFCPGIANCSESNYIRTCVHLIQENGYRSAVLNHLGVLRNIRLTSERIFSYGGNGEMEAMFRVLAAAYPRTRFIGVGFSMGANVMTNCLAKLDPELRDRVILGISVCQGYSANHAAALLMDWECSRRIYNYIITENVKRLLRRNFVMAVQPHVKSGIVNEQQLWAATSLHWLDECYSRRVHRFDTLEAYYEESSCLHRIKNIQIPMIFVNALDDPLVPEPLWAPVRSICASHPRHAFVLLKHGGHLGFLEGSPLKPRPVTWLDRFILQLAEAATEKVAELQREEEGRSGNATTTSADEQRRNSC